MTEDFNPEFNNRQESKETIERPVYISEPTLEATLKKIRSVEREKRKIIVYVGVHPNEGTAELSRKYAEEWSKKFGVLVVCHPTQETPHAIWEAHRTKSSGKQVPPLPKNIELSEDNYEDQFSQGDETFFIRFHGTPVRTDQSGRKERRKLGIFTSMYQDSPDMYTQGRTPLRYSKPEIVQGLDTVIPDVEQSGYPGNVITAEYYYEGTPIETNDPYIKNLLRLKKERNLKGIPKLFEDDDPNWWRKGNIEPRYLVQPILNEEDKREFVEKFVKHFEKMLAYLSRRV